MSVFPLEFRQATPCKKNIYFIQEDNAVPDLAEMNDEFKGIFNSLSLSPNISISGAEAFLPFKRHFLRSKSSLFIASI